MDRHPADSLAAETLGSTLPLSGSGDVVHRADLPFRTDLWLLLLIASQPLESSLSLGGGTVITISKLAGAACVAAFALDWYSTRRSVRFDVTHAILLVLLAIALLSTLQARSQVTGFSTAMRYAGFVALYVVLTQFIGADALLVRIAWVLTAGCAVAGVLALRNFAAGTTLLAKPLYGDPNDLAYMLATALPLSLWLMRYHGWRRLTACFMIAVIVSTLVLTLSRGALLAMVAGGIWLVFRERRYRKIIVAAVLISALPLLLFIVGHRQRVETGLHAKELVAASNVRGRLGFYEVAAGLSNSRPLLGVGPGNFPFYLYTATGGPGEATTFVVHDAYLEVAAELGLPALILFMSYLAIVSVRALAAPSMEGFDVALRVALVIAIVGALPLSEQYYAPFWLLGGLATVLWARDGGAIGRGMIPDASGLRLDA